ncbi:MAG: hypothetical protein JWO39_1624, partial [Gemmatimonadetes bacterium]|nr:hypothetical protein [Gemmatimonadota bacterium]
MGAALVFSSCPMIAILPLLLV